MFGSIKGGGVEVWRCGGGEVWRCGGGEVGRWGGGEGIVLIGIRRRMRC